MSCLQVMSFLSQYYAVSYTEDKAESTQSSFKRTQNKGRTPNKMSKKRILYRKLCRGRLRQSSQVA